MFEQKSLQSLEDYFTDFTNRPQKGVFFYRFNGYNQEIGDFIRRFFEAAAAAGVVIEGKIQNPTEQNLAYYEEIMGLSFQMNPGFLGASMKKWLPRMDSSQRENVAMAVYDCLEAMGREGKNENMLKNAYIKFMCWLYYKFERILNQLGKEKIPKILCEGDVGNYELRMLYILSRAGCDVALLQYQGDSHYRQVDPQSAYSLEYQASGVEAFPKEFSIKGIRQELARMQNIRRLYGPMPESSGCTNAWIAGEGLSDILKEEQERGNDPRFFYNCFMQVNGVEDKLTYVKELYQFQFQLKKNGRCLAIVEGEIPRPTMEEIGAIRRENYSSQEQMLLGLSGNIQYSANLELQKLMVKAFIDMMMEQAGTAGENLNKLTGRGVHLLCWLKRYQPLLFSGWKLPRVGCFIYLGGCRDENEALFVRFLARLPVDVLILNPGRRQGEALQDSLLYQRNYNEALELETFPREEGDIRMGTAAYHAERELDDLMYRDSGLYRNRQYKKAVAVTLRTMYEEIAMLWNQELKYRPNFSVEGPSVSIPVIFAKISGVKGGQAQKYWSEVKALKTEDTFLIRSAPYLLPTAPNPMKACAAEFFQHQKLNREKIKNHPAYPYGYLREETQEYILDKLALLIQQQIIRGTFENGAEYAIIATVLNLEKTIIQLLQKFDFTKKNPKVMYINTTEKMLSLEDSIMAAFLNLAGFDVLFFVPTGYQNVEKYFQKQVFEEHQIGEYVYDMQPPAFEGIGATLRQTWLDRIMRK